MKTLIIIPTYNEKANIPILLNQIIATLPQTHIVVVDDDSPDGTAEEVKRTTATSRHPIHLIQRIGQRGLGTAYKAGFEYGLARDYEVLVTMDADMSHNPVHLPKMLEALQDYDVVIGSRYIRDGGTVNWGIRRIFLSWCANRFAHVLLNLHGHDLTSGYRAYRRKVLEAIDWNTIESNGYSFLVETLFYAQRHHAKICEVPIIFWDRTMGQSKISKHEIYLGAFTLLRLRLHEFSRKRR
jgi:dolichol-phosphate mannosyltransferase